MKRLVYCDKELHALAKSKAALLGVSLKAVIDEAVREWLYRKKDNPPCSPHTTSVGSST